MKVAGSRVTHDVLNQVPPLTGHDVADDASSPGRGVPGGPGVPYGTLPEGMDSGAILDRATALPR
jgi:hypothetical protein